MNFLKKINFYGVSLLICIIFSSSCTKDKKDIDYYADRDWDLMIYSYDSLVTWGLSQEAIPIFEEKYNCIVNVESVGDAGNLLVRASMESKRPRADILIGIDNSYLAQVLEMDLLFPYKAENLKYVPDELHFDSTHHLTPYDYGYLAFVFDTKKVSNPPITFGQMQDGIWRNQYIFIDPRTSSTGRSLLLWSVAAFGENGFGHFWRSIRANILTIPSSWDEAYSMFLAGEAPIVLSYSTSPAFHMMIEKDDRYQAFIPMEGGYRQIEGAGILKSTRNLELAKSFIEFMLTEDFQNLIPTTQWMYPVNKNVKLPAEFTEIPIPDNDFSTVLTVRRKQTEMERWLERWQDIMIE